MLFAVVVLNFYPSTTLKNLLLDAKKSEMLERGMSITTSLQNINILNGESIHDAMAKAQIMEYEEIYVTSAGGTLMYSSTGYGVPKDLAESMRSILLGFDVFKCVYDEQSFRSVVMMPLIRQREVQAVLIATQTDTDSSRLLVNIRNNIVGISISFAVFGGGMVAIFIKLFSTKVSRLVNGVQEMGSGNFGHKIKVSGDDELSKVAQEFNVLAEKLQRVENIRQEFVSNASHELKTPLASIKLLSDSIVQAESMSQEDTLDFLRDINMEIDRLIRITENLLYLTKNDSRPILVKEPCNVAKVAQRCKELLTANASHNMVEISLRVKEDCRILANSDIFYQVVFNIMENAVKYNRENGSVGIVIEKDGAMCKITISDTGIGMPSEELSRIFDRFYRIDKARSRATGGTGLGLSIVHDNIGLLDGTVEVESTVGKGSAFTLRIPLV